MRLIMAWIDQLTRAFWKITGRPVDLSGPHSWLNAVRSPRSEVGDDWLINAAEDAGGALVDDATNAGLLSDMRQLNTRHFDAGKLRPEVRDFYEQTSSWRLEVWAQWNPFCLPAGRLLARYFGRRIKQLTIPTRPLEVALGMDSTVTLVTDREGNQVSAAWIRRLRSSGEFIYSGLYRVQRLPSEEQPSINVSFPLESGNVQIFLRPWVGRDGSLFLTSRAGRFGDNGAYMLVEDDAGEFHAARIPLHETFRIYVDEEGTLRTDHIIKLGWIRVVQLHYKMEKTRR